MLSAAALPGLAATCTVAATPLAYGGYDPLYASPVQVNATVTVSCLVVVGPLNPIGYSVALGTSATTGTMARAMAGPLGARLQYNLYTSAGYSTVWGDGSGGTQTVAGSVTPLSLGAGVSRNHVISGNVPALQSVRVGAYADSIVVTVDY